MSDADQTPQPDDAPKATKDFQKAPDKPDEHLLTDRAAAEFLGVSVRRVHQLRKRGGLPAVHVGWNRWRFRPADLMVHVSQAPGSTTPDVKNAEAAHPPNSNAVADLQAAITEMRPSPPKPDDRSAFLTEEAPVVRMVNAILSTALDSRASDLLIEPNHRHTTVRCRIEVFFTRL